MPAKKQLKEAYELQAIFDLSKVLNSSLNLKTILNTILLTLMGKFLISKGLILVTKSQNEFIIEVSKGLSRTLLGRAISVLEFPTEPCSVDALSCPVTQALFAKNDIVIILPIRHDDKNLGLIGLGKKGIGGNFTDSEIDYLNSLGNISAPAIQNGLIFRELDTEKRKSDKRVQELNTLSEIVRELNSTLSTLKTETVVSLLAYSIMGEMMVNRCAIFLNDEAGIAISLNKGIPAAELQSIMSNAEILSDLKNVKTAMLVDHHNTTMSQAFAQAGVCALIPMCVENETKGMVALGPKITKLPFTSDELNFLTILGNWSVISIETARLIEQEFEKKALEEELRIASEIQNQLLPDQCPHLEHFDIAAENKPSRQVGGDYYDCIKIDEEHYIFCIADVSGKGTPAALLMANLQASLHALVGTNLSLTEITGRINDIIYRNTSYDKFITFFFGLLDIKKRTFTYVNAGHNPPYLFHNDGSFQTLDEGGLILGMMPGVEYQSEFVSLYSGDCILMYTDGVSEAMNDKDEEFEEHRIESCVLNNHALSANDLIAALIKDVSDFSSGCPQADDITALILIAK